MKGVEKKPLYEVGYHLVSSIAEDAVGAEVARIREAIEGSKGVVVSEEWPKRTQLAYTISRKEQSGLAHYDTAYFGWIRFEIDRAQIQRIQNVLEELSAMLRFIVIEVPRAVAAPKKQRARSVFGKTKEKESEAPVSAAEDTSEELDREIEKLVSE